MQYVETITDTLFPDISLISEAMPIFCFPIAMLLYHKYE
jgi:hypothetical protein